MNEVNGRGLSICAGYAEHSKARARLTKERVGDCRKRESRPGGYNDPHARWHGLRRPGAEDRGCTGTDSVANETVAIHVLTGQRCVEGASRHLPRIVGDGGDYRLTVTQDCGVIDRGRQR